jgi:hypothetical protein
MRSSCCRCSFEKQSEGRSRRSAKGAGVARRARAERKSKGETLVSERQDGLQFPPAQQPTLTSFLDLPRLTRYC